MSDQFSLFSEDAQRPVDPWVADAAEEFLAASVVFPEGIAKPLDYAIPESLVGKVQAGCRLEVPLGKANRPKSVYCVGVHTLAKSQIQLKYLSRIVDERPLFSATMLELTKWISDYWLCPWGAVLQTVLPAGVRTQAGTRVATLVCLSQKGREALEWLAAAQKVSKESKKKTTPKPAFKLTPLQQHILEFLRKFGRPIAPEELARRCGTSSGPIQTLRKNGFLETSLERVSTHAGEMRQTAELQDDMRLSPEQQAAFAQIQTLLNASKPGVGLIHGVTGSGKTELYIQAIRQVVRRGQQAIVLVPEISLTPQTVQRFRSRFANIAVLHSKLTDAQRHEQWLQIQRGDVQVVIGARSAIFAPAPRLGLIIIDEEHETSFKQDTAPRYHARDVAVQRGKMENAVVLLGSATPSLESWYHAVEKRDYTLISMPHRIGNRPLPDVETVDLRIRDRQASGAVGRKLHIAMRECLDEKHQMILLLNRRGYSTHVQCPACGKVLECPHCAISLTHHFTTKELICHYCDYREPVPQYCPECGSAAIRYWGTGTQKLEEEITRRFPDARVLRMDSDSMQARGAHEDAFRRFRAGEIDILLGTQMIAKGLDFPNVTLVGVINADTALYLPDFRAEERTFHLITQVAGRTGRGESGGHVLVQTFEPENDAIQYACQHDFVGFANYALPSRQEWGYPPYGAMARLVIRSQECEKAEEASIQLAQAIRAAFASLPSLPEASRKKERVLGPAPCPAAKVRDFYRFHIQVHSPERGRIHDVLQNVDETFKTPANVEWIIDMDPIGML